jgi:hypothetical protein
LVSITGQRVSTGLGVHLVSITGQRVSTNLGEHWVSTTGQTVFTGFAAHFVANTGHCVATAGQTVLCVGSIVGLMGMPGVEGAPMAGRPKQITASNETTSTSRTQPPDLLQVMANLLHTTWYMAPRDTFVD